MLIARIVFSTIMLSASIAVAGAAYSADDKAISKEISVVPMPAVVKPLPGKFVLAADTAIVSDEKCRPAAEYLANLISPPTGVKYAVRTAAKKGSKANVIRFKFKAGKNNLGDEGYSLMITKRLVEITANTPAGAFYAVQTLRQLLPPQIESRAAVKAAWEIPCAVIEDSPRFQWRGLMLDTARHFFPKDFILRQIDLMAMFKMNRLHLHLTDDQGWRIEIKRYPELTKIGAWREKSKREDIFNNPAGKAHGGFYTQDDIREIVAYAQSRFITIVPEIEMPGHAQAALAARNELSCTGAPLKVLTHWGVNKEIYCAGNEETFVFLRNVLSEVAELFPGQYIHVGGDEAVKDRWKECPKCQTRIKAEGLKDEAELQSWFIKRIESFLDSKGKKLIGWDEILEGGLPPRASVMSWRGTQGGILAAVQGHDVVMSPTSNCYFDYPQSDKKEPNSIGAAPLPMCKVYDYEPVPGNLTAAQAKHILGAQGNLWTEHVETTEHAEYMTWPRAAAMAEVGWTRKELKDWAGFQTRMNVIYPHWDVMGLNYRKP